MLLVQEYLLTHSLAQLERDHGVETSCSVGDQFFSLNYNQINSKAGPFTSDCRGLILGVEKPLTEGQLSGEEALGTTKIQARPMNRFFNLSDSNAYPVNFDNPNITYWNKLDGTLCIVYFNTILNSWEVATRSVPTANRTIDGFGEYTFRTLFEKALVETCGQTFEEFTSKLSKELTYCFELTTPLNRVVVDYKEFRVHLLAYRDTETGEEYNGVQNDLHGVPWCPQFKLSSIKEVLEFVSSQNALEHEGVVAMDQNFNRVKIKNLAYVLYHRAKDHAANSPRAVVELILLEKLDDVLPVFGEELKARSEKIRDGLTQLISRTDWLFLQALQESCKYPKEEQRKQFALFAQKQKTFWTGPLFEMYTGKAKSTKDFIMKNQREDKSWTDGFLDTVLNNIKQNDKI